MRERRGVSPEGGKQRNAGSCSELTTATMTLMRRKLEEHLKVIVATVSAVMPRCRYT